MWYTQVRALRVACYRTRNENDGQELLRALVSSKACILFWHTLTHMHLASHVQWLLSTLALFQGVSPAMTHHYDSPLWLTTMTHHYDSSLGVPPTRTGFQSARMRRQAVCHRGWAGWKERRCCGMVRKGPKWNGPQSCWPLKSIKHLFRDCIKKRFLFPDNKKIMHRLASLNTNFRRLVPHC